MYREIEGDHRRRYEETVSGSSLRARPYGDYPRSVIYSAGSSTPDARDLCVRALAAARTNWTGPRILKPRLDGPESVS